jgi:MoaA/NifB/PqqE/SkfB family radical SAM enzyme
MEEKIPRKKTGGRQKGVTNKTTAELKAIITQIVGNQLDRLEGDLDKIRRQNPAKAVEIASKLIDYVLPKQSKMEIEGELKHKVDKIVIEIKKNGSTDTNND